MPRTAIRLAVIATLLVPAWGADAPAPPPEPVAAQGSPAPAPPATPARERKCLK